MCCRFKLYVGKVIGSANIPYCIVQLIFAAPGEVAYSGCRGNDAIVTHNGEEVAASKGEQLTVNDQPLTYIANGDVEADGMTYAVSDTPFGPYGDPVRLDAKLFYAAKHVENGTDAYMVGWARRSESVSSTQDVNGWAGNLCVQKLVQNPDGSLALAPVDAILTQFTARRELLIDTMETELAAGSAYNFADLYTAYEGYCLTGKLRFEKKGTFGLAFDYNGRDDKYKLITLSPSAGTLSLSFNKGTTPITETAAPIEAGKDYTFTFVQEGSVGIFQ